jgi:hypothetical protein
MGQPRINDAAARIKARRVGSCNLEDDASRLSAGVSRLLYRKRKCNQPDASLCAGTKEIYQEVKFSETDLTEGTSSVRDDHRARYSCYFVSLFRVISWIILRRAVKNSIHEITRNQDTKPKHE